MKTLTITLALLALSCSKKAPDSIYTDAVQGEWHETTVKEGQHAFRNRPADFAKVTTYGVTYWLMFGQDAQYSHAEASYQDSWNKGRGIDWKDGLCGGTPQHSNSALLGWRWYNERLQLGWYHHPECGDDFQAGHLLDIDFWQPYMVQVYAMPKGYWLWRVYQYSDPTQPNELARFELPFTPEMMAEGVSFGDLRATWFWFGGKYPAPHGITIYYSLFRPSGEPSSF